MSARIPHNNSVSCSLFQSHSHENLNRYVFQISPEQWERCGFRCCVNPLEQPPFKNGKFPDPPAVLYSRGLKADSHGISHDWLLWMQKLAVASASGFGSCSEILCWALCFPFGPCFLSCSDSITRNRVLRVVEEMNIEFLAPMQAHARLFHCIKTRNKANIKASWLAIGLTEAEIEKIKAEPETVFSDHSRCTCCGGSGGV